MMKLTRLFSRNQLFEQIVWKKAGYVGHPLGSHPFSSNAGISDSTQNFTRTVTKNAGGRVFASYHVYKGKAALSMEPCMPTFTKVESGNFIMDRRGSIMLTFAPAVGERKYDWTRKQLFALSATEIGSLISLGPRDSCEFFHDPGMLSSTAGQVRKSLAIKAHTDGNGYFFSLRSMPLKTDISNFLNLLQSLEPSSPPGLVSCAVVFPPSTLLSINFPLLNDSSILPEVVERPFITPSTYINNG